MTVNAISEILRKKGLRVCAAESFTGGGIASAFVSLPGASDIFSLSLVCYSNEAKHKLLGVPEETLRLYGAVSSQTVSAMLDGLKALGQGDVFVATSGNAGPTSEKPGEVGVAYIGVMLCDKKVVKRFDFSGSRSDIISLGIKEGLKLILQEITDN